MVRYSKLVFGKKHVEETAPPSSGGSVLGSTTIEWDSQFKQNNVLWKVPRLIRLNDNIVVREDEIAVFYRDGKVLTYFDQPNRYALTDLNAPIIGELLKHFTGVQQQAEVYYLQKRFLDGKFGSAQPYQFTDPTFGVVNLRVFGEYRWRVNSPENFINQLVGTFNVESSDAAESRLKEQVIILVYNAIGKMKSQGMKVTDLASSLTIIEQIVLATTSENFGQYGVEINKISGLTISLPDEVQKAIDTRSQMSVLGVNYMQYQAGQAMVDAANNQGGVAAAGTGIGIGLGAGVGLGYSLGGQLSQGMSQQPPTKTCSGCGSAIFANAAFCPNCGLDQSQQSKQMDANQTYTGTISCPKCRMAIPAGSKYCSNCGNSISQSKSCPKCGAQPRQGAKFCSNCGQQF